LLKTWLNGTWSPAKGGEERGKDYNHSSFIDLIIAGLIGLIPRSSDVLVIYPLLPPGVWPWFCLDHVRYKGRMLTIVWDETGIKFGLGSGLRVYVNRQLLVSSATLSPVRARLPPLSSSQSTSI
jgi:hypothetical protein